jgi:F-box-like
MQVGGACEVAVANNEETSSGPQIGTLIKLISFSVALGPFILVLLYTIFAFRYSASSRLDAIFKVEVKGRPFYSIYLKHRVLRSERHRVPATTFLPLPPRITASAALSRATPCVEWRHKPLNQVLDTLLMTVMKFLKHIRSKSKVKDKDTGQSRRYPSQYYPSAGRDATARLPPAILEKIFIELCPLTVDDTYDSSEESLVDYGCALCDVKDLAQCALVSRRWWNAAQDLLYEPLLQGYDAKAN